MKKLLPLIALILLLGTSSNQVQAQTTTSFSAPLIWGSSPFQDSLWSIDTTTWTVVNRMGPTLAGFTITGMTGLAVDPTTGITYIIMKLSAVTGRVLGTINLSTGVCTQIGNLGDNFSSIAFDETGQLWGATGNGATVSETLYKIDKNTGVKTLQYGMGNGADGEILCYNRVDDNMYHWSGNGTMVMEKWPIGNLTYTPTNIPVTGLPGGETFGMLYTGPTSFIVSNISSSLKRVNTSGAYGATNLTGLPDDWRGLIMLPYFNTPVTSVCEGTAISMTAGGHQLFDSLYFHWGDGSSDSMAVVNGQLLNTNHTYAAAGTYTATVETYNGFGGDTVYTVNITINPTPVVTLGGLTTICSGAPTVLTSNAPSGTYQWYMNGVLLPNDTNATYTTTSAGVYNMYCVNTFGCADSSAVSLVVVAGTNPVVALGSDSSFCSMATLDAGNAGSSYSWSTGDSTQMIMLMSSTTVSVVVTDALGCTDSDTITVTINTPPTISIGPDTTVCGSYSVDAGNSGSTYMWCNGATTQTTTLVNSGSCIVTVTDANGCSSNDTISVVINQAPVVNLGSDSAFCGTGTIDAGNAGSSYLWNDNSTSQTLTASSSGAYFVTVTDALGCTANDTINVTINNNPVVNIGPDTSDCSSVTLSSNLSGMLMWSDNSMGNSIVVTTSGSYWLSVTDSTGCYGIDTVNVTIFGLPTVTISASSTSVCDLDADVILTGSPAGGAFTGTSVTGSNFDPSIGSGAYPIQYTYTDSNGCSGNSIITIAVSPCVGIQESNATVFTMFPNPSTGVINLNLSVDGSTVEVFDVLGNKVSGQKYNNAGAVQVDLSNQPQGVYFIQVTAGTNKMVQKVIIQK